MGVYKEENIVIADATTHFGGQPIGWTRDGLTIGQEDEKLKIDDVQQKQGVVDVRRTKAGFIVKLNMYENTLENIRLAFGINSSVSYGVSLATLSILMTGDYHEGELLITTCGPDDVARTFTFYKAKLIDRGDLSMDAYGATIIPVTFQVLIHPDYTALGKIEEEYVPASIV